MTCNLSGTSLGESNSRPPSCTTPQQPTISNILGNCPETRPPRLAELHLNNRLNFYEKVTIFSSEILGEHYIFPLRSALDINPDLEMPHFGRRVNLFILFKMNLNGNTKIGEICFCLEKSGRNDALC